MAMGIAVLALLTGLCLLFPLLRLPIMTSFDSNEGWAAQSTMRAMGAGPLYPPPGSFFFNNYPPLSFYLVGFVSVFTGDVILAGRIISLLSLLAVALNIGAIVRNLGGDRSSALTAGLLTLAIFARDFINYVGMNDPQMLAHAVMSAGFVIFTAAPQRLRNLAVGAALMVLAAFIKHNIVAMPLAVTTWLYCNDRKSLWRWLGWLLGFVVAGLALCAWLYGRDFFLQMMMPRDYDLHNIEIDLGRMQAFFVPLVIWIIFAVQSRPDPRISLISHLIAAGAFAYALNRAGDGVAENSLFDMAIGCCIGLGLALSRAAESKLARRYGADKMRALIFVALCLRIVTPPPEGLLHLSAMLEELRNEAAAQAADLAFARTRPGPAICADLAFCTWSGHLSEYAWALPALAARRDNSLFEERIRRGDFALIQVGADDNWPAVHQAQPPFHRYLIRAGGALFYR
jgi:Dolichyl-phosphate-mannose-protein mannosyltransferase